MILKKIITIIFVFFSLTSNSTNCVKNTVICDSIGSSISAVDSINNFVKCVEEWDLNKAKTYESVVINNFDLLSLYDKMTLADYYIGIDQYNKCKSLCDYIVNQDSTLYENFSVNYGECYFYLKDPDKAYEYFKTYLEFCNKNDINDLGLYYNRIIALTMKESHHYNEADIYFDKYLQKIMDDENLNIENIYTSKKKESLGYFLYTYAYNKIFQGKEFEGLKYLKLASYCGYEYANEDYNILSKSPTFAKHIELKGKYIKKFDKFIEKFDTYKNFKTNPTVFWDGIKNNSEEYKILSQTLKKEKKPGTLKKALANFDEDEFNMFLYQLSPFDTCEVEKVLRKSLCGYQDYLKDLRIFPNDSKNAFTTPYGHIYITSGLVSSYHIDYDLLLSICAHEATHYICQHTIINAWKYEKKKKTNNIIAGISSGLAATASTISAAYASTYMSEEQRKEYMDDINQGNVDLINSSLEQARISALFYKYRYSRDQELEADLVAYRFCESIGIGGYVFISALELLGDESAYMKADKDSDHPTTAYRVSFLKYLYDKEHNTNYSHITID